MLANEFCCFAYSTAHDVGAASAERFNDFRARCDFAVALKLPVFLPPSENHDVGGLGKDCGDGDSKHLLAAKYVKLGGEHDPLRRLLLLLLAGVTPATLED